MHLLIYLLILSFRLYGVALATLLFTIWPLLIYEKNIRVRYAFILIVRFNVEIIIILVDDK